MKLPLAVLAVVVAYLVGTFPSAQLAGRLRGIDPTRAGSRNPGATNVLRTAGRRAAALTLLGDLGKGIVPSVGGLLLGGHGLGVACGVAAVVGHVAPVTRRFRGGKGVATGMGMLLVLFPWAALVAAVVFGLAVVTTRIAAVGSLLGAPAAFITVAVLGAPGPELAGLALCMAVIVARHGENIGRLLRGEEQRTTRFRRPPQT